jgi:para-aminobenzoate synthetase
MRTLLIDNYDSFTFNLFQLLAEVNGEEPTVVRNDSTTWRRLARQRFDNVVVSPGPGRPERPADFGVCTDAIRSAKVPVLGVCLGHQGLGYLAGGTVAPAPEVVHGRLSAVLHDESELFAGIPSGFEAVRYHSLCVTDVPPSLEVIAWTEDDVVMGLRDVARPRFGVQFHPESICTSHGRALLENFRDLTLELAPPSQSRPSRAKTVVPVRAVPVPEEGPPTHQLLVRQLDVAPDAEQVFLGLFGADPHGWWLDSSRPDDPNSRFSFMGGSDGPLSERVYYDVGAGEVTVVRGDETETHRETVFDYLQRRLDAIRTRPSGRLPFAFDCGFVGYLGYELKADCAGAHVHRSTMPDACFLLADRLIAFDHREQAAYLVCLVDEETEASGRRWLDVTAARIAGLRPPGEPVYGTREEPVDFYLARTYERYLADIERCRHYLNEGETYEVCLTNKIKTDVIPDPLVLYRFLRRVNPAPFAAFMRDDERAIACSSPERFLRVARNRWVEATPIKGTARRDGDATEDMRLAEELRADEKNRAENLMITDLVRNDLGLVCEIGTVHVPHLFAVESFETVHQLVSTIRGRLRAELGVTDCIRACYPGGSMTGAPKKRTMEIIDELEDEARGVYSGALGYLALCGAADFNIVIRTVVMDGEETSIGVGGAIVVQSDPDDEYDETILKAEALMKAVVLCVNGPGETVREQSDAYPLVDELQAAARSRVTVETSRRSRRPAFLGRRDRARS